MVALSEPVSLTVKMMTEGQAGEGGYSAGKCKDLSSNPRIYVSFIENTSWQMLVTPAPVVAEPNQSGEKA